MLTKTNMMKNQLLCKAHSSRWLEHCSLHFGLGGHPEVNSYLSAANPMLHLDDKNNYTPVLICLFLRLGDDFAPKDHHLRPK